jgi:glutathione S-transferase
MNRPTLVIGNRNYSSWSLRPWILARHLEIEIDEILIPLDTPTFRAEALAYSHTGRVPVLIHDGIVVPESLAILEYLSELADGRGWPKDRADRARARAVATEMHAGFSCLRRTCPMNIRATGRRVTKTPELAADIAAIDTVFTQCRTRHATSGPWLFGDYSAADAMYLPVAFRFRTYGLEGLSATAQAYIDTAIQDPLVEPWVTASIAETALVPSDEAGL